ncbi:factor V activator RVV-V alpha-like [Helicoverpa zea]|uniref:factor V activator RVV-V alpha-like n=1 Tax=Helicoverpa zea TaxID=7113 RepID=UPI001F5AA199|nr:factor V activator RVV-V alpha-like [Helicoverpa zea]
MYSYILCLCLSVITVHGAASPEIQKLVYEGFRHDPKEHGFMVLIGKFWSNHTDQFKDSCTGSIIDKEWIITAAHCFLKDVTDVPIIQRIKGKQRLIGYVRQRDIIMHPNYLPNEPWQYDLALLRTEKPIPFDEYASPIPLAWSRGPGQEGLFGGYGESEFGSGTPLIGEAVLEETCLAPFARTPRQFLCSRSTESITAHGDSGGPVFTRDGLVGVILGVEESLHESVFLDISQKFNWIEQVTGIYPQRRMAV